MATLRNLSCYLCNFSNTKWTKFKSCDFVMIFKRAVIFVIIAECSYGLSAAVFFKYKSFKYILFHSDFVKLCRLVRPKVEYSF